jgi:apolipoprotein N-acyltransferase
MSIIAGMRVKVNDFFDRLTKASWRWQRSFLFICGAISSAGFAPLNNVYLFFAGLVPALALIVRQSTIKTGFFAGLWFGIGEIFSISWLFSVCDVLGENPNFAGILLIKLFAVSMQIFLILYLAIYFGIAGAITTRFIKHKLFVFALAFAVCEYFRQMVFPFIPWNNVFLVWYKHLPMLQSISIFGAYFLSFLTVLLAGFLLQILSAKHIAKNIIYFVLCFGLNYGYGYVRLKNNPTEYDENYLVRLVNIKSDHADKWNPQNAEKQIATYQKYSMAPRLDGKTPRLIVWPETAIIKDLRDNGFAQQVTSFLKPEQNLVAGYIRYSFFGDMHNTLGVFNSKGEILNFYDKRHLFPFWEYQPLGDWNLTSSIGPSKLEAGHKVNVLFAQGKSFFPIICYEGGFSSSPYNHLPRANFMVVASNDIWFLNMAKVTNFKPFGFDYMGPMQHYQDVPLRSIELGLPAYRSANAGVNAVIDPFGREIKTHYYEEGYVDEFLIKPASPTPYTWWGDSLFLMVGAIILLALNLWQNFYVSRKK